jgi:putative membrane protein
VSEYGSAAVPGTDRAGTDLADGEWHRMHPLTPAVKSWRALIVVLVVVLHSAGGDTLGNLRDLDRLGVGNGVVALVVLGVIVVVLLLAGGAATVSWRAARFRIGADALELNQGVLFRQHRSARLDRVQTVEVAQPFVARLVGLARLTLEVAGGSDSNIRLEYLTEAQAQSLRNHLLARAAGVQYQAGQEAPEAPENVSLEVPVMRLIGSLVLSGTAIALVIGIVALVVGSALAGSVGPVVGAVPVVIGFVTAVWGRFNGGFGFRIAQSPDGLRLRFGLLEHRSQTVPPGRVQSVRLSQPLLWRAPDWWTVEVNLAGVISSGREQQRETGHRLLPVGTRAEAVGVLSLVLPDLGVRAPEDPWQLVDAGLTGTRPDAGFIVAPRRSRWVDLVAWRRTGVRVTDEALLIRRGRVRRMLDVVPHARAQSLGLEQGPLQRRLRVATFTVHSTPGPIHPQVPHLDEHEAARLLEAQAIRAEGARAASGPELWMSTTEREAVTEPPAAASRSIPDPPGPAVPPS